MLGIMVSSTLNSCPFNAILPAPSPLSPFSSIVDQSPLVSKNGHRTPTIIVVKCGMPQEANEKKPGNRGKRDSQLILMNFFLRVTYNDRMTPLDFDLFRKIWTLMGVTPDYFEVVLMVSSKSMHSATFQRNNGNSNC